MARVGQVLDEGLEQIEFLETAATTGGRRVKCRVTLAPARPAPPEHSHPALEERFVVECGVLGYVLGGRKLRATAGDLVLIPPGTNHTFWNDGTSQLSLISEISPAMRFEDFVETIHVLIRDGRLRAGGSRPNPFLLATIARAYRHEWRLTKLSPIARRLLPILAFLGRRIGYRPHYSPDGEERSPSAQTAV